MGRGSNGVICLTFGDFERSDQGHLLKNTVFVRDSAIVEHFDGDYNEMETCLNK